MFAATFFLRAGLFAEGRFLGKVLDQWAGDAQEFVSSRLPDLVLTILIAFALSRLIVVLTQRMIVVAERNDASAARQAQVKTFSGILRTTLNAVLWTLTALQMFSNLGVNLGPLLASAGVAGIAVGLAAQTIVKDILNGTLILLEDQFNVGDSVRITGMSGVVEAMTLRRTEIRDGDGTLYVVPNSQITTVANLSREFSQATVNVSVDFSTPPDKVLELLRRISMEVRNDPRFTAVFLADPQVLGVDAMHGSEMVYPVLFRTRAGQQYAPVREFRRRIRLALEEHNMLPGDPYRTFREFSSTSEPDAVVPADAMVATQQAEQARREKNKPAAVDPTAIPAQEHDLFGSE
uniref:MscS Mechanosensitive ion channel n=1 Tax=mine drainage metagenome TaxID=410659 RepID=E6QHU0_9ZZZZ